MTFLANGLEEHRFRSGAHRKSFIKLHNARHRAIGGLCRRIDDRAASEGVDGGGGERAGPRQFQVKLKIFRMAFLAGAW